MNKPLKCSVPVDLRVLAQRQADRRARNQSQAKSAMLAAGVNEIDRLSQMRCKQIEALAIGARAILRTDPAPYELDAALELIEWIVDESAGLTNEINVKAGKLGCNFVGEAST